MKKFYFLLLALCFITSAKAQIINFPDANFKAKLLAANTSNFTASDVNHDAMVIDANSNGEIEVSEALNVYILEIQDSNIQDLTGIAYFTNLWQLTCRGNQLTNLDVSNLNLAYLFCGNNQIGNLNLGHSNNLNQLDCRNNSIHTLDLSNQYNLDVLFCQNNLLTIVNLKTGREINGADIRDFANNPTVRYICCDSFNETYYQSKIDYLGYSGCQINSYCSFSPGGSSYTVQGNIKYDFNNDGCDTADSNVSNLIFSVADGTNIDYYLNDNGANYSISVPAGQYTVTPLLENPTYFSVSPSNVVVNFPTQASPFTQNFCVTANGVHPDLEVILTPLVPARPGFDAVYKLIYKNKGTNTQSGDISLNFNDAVLDFVSATPAIATQTTNNLSWNFANLLPFETREITFTLNVNSPMEAPAVNGGDVLNYTASVISVATDETPADNTFTLNQTVVNSYDPNDKTCLEGATIAPSEVGKYVHYMIRFENTGTFPAENIVVKDMIDTNKFDINTLVPIKGSHDFFTRINGNKVEFIFENINLPFDDANNDGYVAFKIKTKPTLVAGNTFSNSASIYFDYNFPIVTNTAVTTIQALSTQDFAFGTYFAVYPNPVNNVLNIETKQTIEVSSVNIYNQLGQLVLVVPNAQNAKSVDVSSLSAGNYFIKINSDKGTSNTKFVKK